MEKKKWLWKTESSERSPGESESSESFSSHSERYSDEQDSLRESSNDSTQSPEASSRAIICGDEVKESVKNLTEKLSAALVNVSAKEDLVKQHVKVAEEAVAGWEKAENEVTALKQQLEVAVQQNLNLEVRVSHLDGALKECVRQLRQARDEQEKLSDAMVDKNGELESTKSELEKQIYELQAQAQAVRIGNAAFVDPKTQRSLEVLKKENSSLKVQLVSLLKGIEIITIERDLITQAAETASKLQLESIKKVSKLEAECKRLQAVARKSSPNSNQKSVTASSFCTESLTDSHSDSWERTNLVDNDICKTSSMETNVFELSCSDSWASALITELDQFKNERPVPKSLVACSIEIDMMDDFLEMERLAALPETKSNTHSVVFESSSTESISTENPLKPELDSMIQRIIDLEKKLEKIELEKLELEIALDKSLDSLKAGQRRMAEAEISLEDMQKELAAVHEAKDLLEFQARTMSANVDSLNAEVEKERTLSSELTIKCQELEKELSKNIQETELHQNTNSNGKQNLKQEDLAVAANKLAECQKTIASLGRQLQSLATLEDFLIDTSNIPGFSRGPLFSDIGGETWKLSSNDMFIPKCDSDLDNGSLNDHGKLFSPS